MHTSINVHPRRRKKPTTRHPQSLLLSFPLSPSHTHTHTHFEAAKSNQTSLPPSLHIPSIQHAHLQTPLLRKKKIDQSPRFPSTRGWVRTTCSVQQTNTHVTGNKREKERGAAEVKVVVVETQGTVLYCTGTRVSSIYYTYCAGMSENGKKRKGEKKKNQGSI